MWQWLLVLAELPDHGMKLKQSIGAAQIAVQEGNFGLASTKLDKLQEQLNTWRTALKAAEQQASTAVPVEAPKPPTEVMEFSVNVTHVPERCKRKSEEGATMKIHYVGKLIATGKLFASSFHTGSQPFRFILGSKDVTEGLNRGLYDMCEGERRRIYVPWELGYGAEGTKGVPPYSNLRYDLELVELNVPKIPKTRKKGKQEL